MSDKINKRNAIMIVVDAQNDFVSGVLGTKEAQDCVDRICAYCEAFAQKDIAQIFTIDKHSAADYDKCLEYRYGIPLHCAIEEKDSGNALGEGANLDHRVGEVRNLIQLSCYGNFEHYQHYPHVLFKESFGFKRWRHFIKACYPDLKVKEIYICGLCTDICVIMNAMLLRTAYPNAKITVLKDACAGTTPEMHEKALDVMKSCLIDVVEDFNCTDEKE